MSVQQFLELFGLPGVMLAAMVYDRKRLLDENRALRQRNDDLNDRMLERTEKHLDDAIRLETELKVTLGQLIEHVKGVA